MITLKPDGAVWCAFVGKNESRSLRSRDAGFGDDPAEALLNLKSRLQTIAYKSNLSPQLATWVMSEKPKDDVEGSPDVENSLPEIEIALGAVQRAIGPNFSWCKVPHNLYYFRYEFRDQDTERRWDVRDDVLAECSTQDLQVYDDYLELDCYVGSARLKKGARSHNG